MLEPAARPPGSSPGPGRAIVLLIGLGLAIGGWCLLTERWRSSDAALVELSGAPEPPPLYQGSAPGADAPPDVAAWRRHELSRLRQAVPGDAPEERRVALVDEVAALGLDGQVLEALRTFHRYGSPAVVEASRAALARLGAALLRSLAEPARPDDPVGREVALQALSTARPDVEVLVGLADALGAAAREPTTDLALELLVRTGGRGASGFRRAAEAPGGSPGWVLYVIGRLPPPDRTALAPVVLQVLVANAGASGAEFYEDGLRLVSLDPAPDVAALEALLELPLSSRNLEDVVRLLGRLGPRAERAAPALMRRLSSDELWRPSCRALSSIGVAPGLAAAIDGETTTGRLRALVLATKLPSAGRAAVPAILRAAAEEELAHSACVALDALEAEELTLHLPAIGALLRGPTAPHVVRVVRRLGPAARPLLADLLAYAVDDRRFVHALTALRTMRLTPADEVTALVSLLGGPDGLVAAVALELSCARGEGEARSQAVASAVPGLIGGLGRASPGTRSSCLLALERLGVPEGPRAAAPALARLLQDPDLALRARAARLLRSLGPLDEPTGGALRTYALHEAELRALVEGLDDPDPTARASACQRLGEWTHEASGGVEALAASVGDADPSVRAAAIAALCSLGEAGRAGAPAVGEAVGDQDPEVRAQAVRYLRSHPHPVPGEETRERLLSCLAAGAFELRRDAAIALGLMRDGRTEVACALVEVLERETDASQLEDAIRACSLLSGDAPPAQLSAALEAVAVRVAAVADSARRAQRSLDADPPRFGCLPEPDSLDPIAMDTRELDELQALWDAAAEFVAPTRRRVAAVEALAALRGQDERVLIALDQLRLAEEPLVVAASRAALRRLDPAWVVSLLDRTGEDGRDASWPSLAFRALEAMELDVVVRFQEAIGRHADRCERAGLELLRACGARAGEGLVLAAQAVDAVAVLRAIEAMPREDQVALAPVVLRILRPLGGEDEDRAFQLGARLLRLDPSLRVDDLLPLLDPARHAACRSPIVDLLQALGPRAAPAVPALLGCLGDESLTRHVRDAVVAIGVAPGLAAAIDSGSTSGRSAAIEIAGALPRTDPEVAPALLRALAEPDLREGALALLAKLGAAVAADSEAAAAVPTLVVLLSQGSLRVNAARVLEALGPSADPAAPTLREAALSDDDPLRAAAERALARLSTDAAGPGVLLRWLSEPDAKVRALALRLLGERMPDAPVPVEPLVAAVSDPDAYVRRLALLTLGKLDALREASAAVGGAIDDPDEVVRLTATWLAWRLPDPDAGTLARLVARLGDADVPVRQCAGIALGLQGDGRVEVVRALVEALEGEDPTLIEGAARACARLGPSAEAALPALEAQAARGLAARGDLEAAIAAVRSGR